MLKIIGIFYGIICMTLNLFAGPYAPAAGKEKTTAIELHDTNINFWASGYSQLKYGVGVDTTFQTPTKGLGQALGDPYDIVSLGRGGMIILTFDYPITNGQGWDFVIFENAFDDHYLELAYVEVSSNGTEFTRFDNFSQTLSPISSYGTIDPTNIDGLAGKYRIGYGTPFDLSSLYNKSDVTNGNLNLCNITHVKIIDIIGDKTAFDNNHHPIYDPYPTNSSAGFDLEAVGARYNHHSSITTSPESPIPSSPVNNTNNLPLITNFQTEPFKHYDINAYHAFTQWQFSINSDFTDNNLIFNQTENIQLTTLNIPPFIFENETTYYWRVRFFDNCMHPSNWSENNQFTTGSDSISNYTFMDWDGDGTKNQDIPTIEYFNSNGTTIFTGAKIEENATEIQITTLKEYPSVDFFNIGKISLAIQTKNPDQPVKIKIYFSEIISTNTQWYSYHYNHGWKIFPYTSINLEEQTITLELKDGNPEKGDLDGLKNGKIILQGGAKQSISSTTVGSSDNLNAGQCFISTINPDLDN